MSDTVSVVVCDHLCNVTLASGSHPYQLHEAAQVIQRYLAIAIFINAIECLLHF